MLLIIMIFQKIYTIYFWTNGFDSICEYRGQPIESKSFAFVFPDE